MRLCSHCGATLDDDALFCTACGNKVEAPSGRICPSCGALLDADSLFCSECGTRLAPPVTPCQPDDEPVLVPPVATSHADSEGMAATVVALPDDEPEESSTNTVIVAVVAALAALLVGIGGYWYYQSVYLPKKTDREAPRYYTTANAVVLRSSRSAGVDYNKIASLPYGTELITYEHDSEWSRVKVSQSNAESNGIEGYVASSLLLPKADFFLLNSIFGNQDSRECITTTKCRMALLEYFKQHRYIGKMDKETYTESGIVTRPTIENQWQVFCRPKSYRFNNVFFGRLYDKHSRFTDFAVIIQNTFSGQRKLLYFYFDEEETSHLLAEQDAPEQGYIRNIVITRDGYLRVTYDS